MSAFAVFCATDGSLIFYNRDTVPTAGSEFEGKVASNVYTGFDTTTRYTSVTSVPWYNEMASIISVAFMDEISPKNMQHWFNGASAMTSFNSSNLNTSNSGGISNTFYNCSSLTDLDLSSFNTSNFTNMGSAFRGCSNLTSLNLSSFDTAKVTTMNSTFYGCSSLTSLNLNSFDTSEVTAMAYMFRGCSNLKTIYVSDLWTTDAVTSSNLMFYGCTKLVGAIPFNSSVTDKTHANYETGYLTYKRYVIPEDMIIQNTTLYDLADKIRILTGITGNMTPRQMIDALDTIAIVATDDGSGNVTDPAGLEEVDV